MSSASEYQLELDMGARVWQLSVADKQRLEILRTLTRGANVLILDEPTSVLTPTETEGLFDLIRRRRDEGESVVFISHKLREVLAIADRITVMRQGKNVETLERAEADVDTITRADDRRRGADARAAPGRMPGATVMEVEGLTVARRPRRGRRSRPLADPRRGRDRRRRRRDRQRPARADRGARGAARAERGERSGSTARDLAGRSCRAFVRAGVGFVPEDRLGTGLAGSETIWRNAIMRRYGADQLTRGPLLDRCGLARDGTEGRRER